MTKNRTPIPSKEKLQELFSYENGDLICKIPLTKNPRKNSRKVGESASYKGSEGRFRVTIDRRVYFRSRLIWAYFNGACPHEIDHIDRDKTNDRIENLRPVDRYLNAQNINAAGVLILPNGKFRARIFKYGKHKNLGCFSTYEEARTAYLTAQGD